VVRRETISPMASAAVVYPTDAARSCRALSLLDTFFTTALKGLSPLSSQREGGKKYSPCYLEEESFYGSATIMANFILRRREREGRSPP
jgi:hypothetical protein